MHDHTELLNSALSLAISAASRSCLEASARAADIALLQHHQSRMTRESEDHCRARETIRQLKAGQRRYGAPARIASIAA